MKRTLLALLGLILAFAVVPGYAQTAGAKTVSVQTTGGSDPKAQKLFDQMVEALGGPLWLGRRDIYTEGYTAAFFHGTPTGANIPFWSYRHLPYIERIEFTKKRDDVMLFTADAGYEITYKGKVALPKDQMEDTMRRRHHSLEEVAQVWMKQPGVVLVSEGTDMVGRRLADKFSVLAPDNDAVTIETDQTTHLPLRRSYRYRNLQFKDWDEDAEEYEDYHDVQGFPTAYSVTRYHNGDMQNQRFIQKVIYNQNQSADIYDVDKPLLKKK